MKSIHNVRILPAKLIVKIIDPVITTIKGTWDIRSDTSSNECSPLIRFSNSPLIKELYNTFVLSVKASLSNSKSNRIRIIHISLPSMNSVNSDSNNKRSNHHNEKVPKEKCIFNEWRDICKVVIFRCLVNWPVGSTSSSTICNIYDSITQYMWVQYQIGYKF